MLKYLEFDNFKSWERAEIKFSRITGFFGTNSSGKSSLLQLLLLLKQTKNATDRGLVLDFGGYEQLVNLGSYGDVIFAHDTTRQMSWKLGWTLPKSISIEDSTKKRGAPIASGTDLSIETSVGLTADSKAISCSHIKYSFGGSDFEIRPREGSGFELLSESSSNEAFRFVRNKQRAWALPGPIKTYLFPDQAKTYFQNAAFLSDFETEYEKQMDGIYYLGPLREYPKRDYQWAGASPSDVGIRGEKSVDAILAATAKNEKRSIKYKSPQRPFQVALAIWLKELNLIHDFRIAEIGEQSNLYRAVVKKDKDSPEALLTDVGFGVSQILPALVLLLYVPKGSTVIMEQPEIHLHPSVQAGLADIMISAAKARNLQIIIESHSEHILRRFQRRIAEESCSQNDVSLYFCSTNNGHSELEPLNLNMFGEISNWPADFFGDTLSEIAETQRSALKRKIAEAKK